MKSQVRKCSGNCQVLYMGKVTVVVFPLPGDSSWKRARYLLRNILTMLMGTHAPCGFISEAAVQLVKDLLGRRTGGVASVPAPPLTCNVSPSHTEKG